MNAAAAHPDDADNRDHANDDPVDHAARAVADPTRRAILRLVRDGEHTVSAIAANFEVSRPAISQHLRVLHDAELVTVRDEGTRRYYRARPEGMEGLRQWMDGFWRDSLASLKTEVEQEQWRKKGAARRDQNGSKNA